MQAGGGVLAPIATFTRIIGIIFLMHLAWLHSSSITAPVSRAAVMAQAVSEQVVQEALQERLSLSLRLSLAVETPKIQSTADIINSRAAVRAIRRAAV